MSPARSDDGRLHAIMAGRGDPYSVMTPLRLKLVRGLHDSLSISEMGERYELSTEEVRAELAPLVEAHLVTQKGQRYVPAFVIADAGETRKVDEHAQVIGRELADALLSRWSAIESSYERLAIHRDYSLSELAFLLVGDRILDVGLLDALAGDETLMPSAPSRPGPGQPDARYYFWMIEGNYGDLGRYGQRSTSLPWNGWEVLTFGLYEIDEMPNVERDRLEAKVETQLASGEFDSPVSLAQHVELPAIGPEDTEIWAKVVRAETIHLIDVYQDNAAGLHDLYDGLRASTYTTHGFGEFMCWYDHLAYSHAIDGLATAGVLSIPQAGFTAALWCDLQDSTF